MGWNYSDSTDALQYCAPLAYTDNHMTPITTSLATFDLYHSGSGTATSSLWYNSASYRKFLVPLQGGFDGCSPTKTLAVGADIGSANLMGFNIESAGSSN